MAKVYAALLAASILWIFGSLPWLVINFFACTPTPSIACLHPTDYRQQALLVLTFDMLLLAVGILAALQLRHTDPRGDRRRRR